MTQNGDLLKRVFRPRGVAVIGASARPNSLGTRYLGGLIRHGYTGAIYPVNPKYETVMGLPCYPSILDVPGDCDTAVLSVREELVEETLIECARRGLAGVIVFAGGYRETGPEGAEKERRLTDLARRCGIRFVGPNSPGFINFIDRATVTATSVAFRNELPPPGRLGIVAQSGGVAGILAERAMDRGIGLSYMLCSGNEADFDTPEAIEYLVDDEYTAAIAVYQEGIKDGPRLVRAWERSAAAGKPVVLYTPRDSAASERAAAAHTGSLAGDDVILDGITSQLGVIRVHDLDEMLEVAAALPGLPARDLDHVLLLTTSGGGAVVSADALGRVGIDLPELAPDIQRELAASLARFGVFHNPVDMTSDFVQNPELFGRSIEIVCTSADHDLVVLIITVQGPEFARTLAEAIVATPHARGGDLVVMWYAGEMSADARAYLRSEGVTVFETPRSLATALAAARLWNRRVKALPSPPPTPERPAGLTDAASLFALLDRHGVPVASNSLVVGDASAATIASTVPPPWAVKTASITMGRKSDAGAVRLGVAGAAELEEAVAAVRETTGGGPVLVQTMVRVGFELLLSVKHDPVFGPMVVLGVGGRMTELHRRVTARRAPLDAADLRTMLDAIGLLELAEGFRDVPPLSLESLAAAANGLARAAAEVLQPGSILEVNPLVIQGNGGDVVCVDVRVEHGDAKRLNRWPVSA